MAPRNFDNWYVFKHIKEFPDGVHQYDYYVWNIETKARESAGVDTRLSNELEGFETSTGRQHNF